MEMINVRGQDYSRILPKSISIPYDDINYLKCMLQRIKTAWESGDTIILKHILEIELPREIKKKEGDL